MPVQTSYPGVYVQEVPSGVRTIVGVSTAVALFIGRVKQGRMNQPVQCLSYTDFIREFSSDTSLSDMPYYVKLFFMNGGTNCYVIRIANGASQAKVDLRPQSGGTDEVLTLTASQHGLLGETIRGNVTYSGAQPEHTFNLVLFRWETNAAGIQTATDSELHSNLSMDPNAPRYAPDIISQDSNLVDAAIGGALPALIRGYSQAGRLVQYAAATPTTLRTAWDGLTGINSTGTSQFQISVDGSPYVEADLSGINIPGISAASVGAFETGLATEIQTAIHTAFNNAGILGIAVTVSFLPGPTPSGASAGGSDATHVLMISSDNTEGESAVVILPARTNDLAATLMLGTDQGGLEVVATTPRRPAPNGMAMEVANYTDADFLTFSGLAQNAITQINLDAFDSNGLPITANIPVDLVTTDATGADPMYVSDPATANGDRDGIREKLAIIRDTINDWQTANSRTFFWRADLKGTRLNIYSTRGEDNIVALNFGPVNLANLFTSNVRYYSVGVNGTGGFQDPAASLASDGSAPLLTDFDNAYLEAEKQVELFNLLILPPDKSPAISHTDLWGPASIFCQEQRAFLLMDAPTSWTTSQLAANGVDALRVGLVNDHSAVFFPQIQINDDGRLVYLGASGAIAGLMARIDSSRGVWKAPAGTEASIRGVTGLRYQFSDGENGVMNPQGINTLRLFPNGIVNWGARTMDGDDDFASEYKYIPVRRTALFIEESLYRGLKWVVFEPNDEPLWAQIRLNVGAFMHNLFRQGAFQGATKKEAYFVKCDSETTTQNDINLGIVNIWVGFAPLKPAEFVILYLQQMTGQIEV